MENRNKYFAIRNYLLSQNVESLLLSIKEIEGILGFELPSTAITNNEWWRWSPNSDSHPHAKNWNTIGWEVKLNTRQQTVLFSNTNYISDSELKKLNLSISEYEFYKDYPRRYVSKINLSVDDWINLLNPDQQIFTEDNISFLKRIYLSPNHATTCYSLAILEESSPSAYNFPMVALAKRIINQLSLSPLYGEDGLQTYWRYLFWGRYVDNHKHFEWLLRPELLIALKTLYPDLSIKFNTSTQRVERAIRHAIEVSWNRGDIDLMEEIFGHSVDIDRAKPTNSEFIVTIADKLRLDMINIH